MHNMDTGKHKFMNIHDKEEYEQSDLLCIETYVTIRSFKRLKTTNNDLILFILH